MSTATYDVATDVTACGVCKAGEHGRCRGGCCTCQRPFCVRLRPITTPVPVPRPAPIIQEAPPVAEPVTTPSVELPESGHAVGEHVCSQCGRRFSRPQGLSRHRNETHGIKAAPARPASKRSTWKARTARKAAAPTPPPQSGGAGRRGGSAGRAARGARRHAGGVG